MNTIIFEDFTYFGDIVYELSKRMLLEKVVYLSICYFTLATEIRFMELDKKLQDSLLMKNSEIYHLRAI